MQFLILACLLGLAVSAPSGGYSSGGVVGGFDDSHEVIVGGGIGGGGFGGGGFGGGGFGGGGFGGGVVGGGYGQSCGHGQVRHVDGSCVTPQVSRNVFVYNAPHRQVSYGPPPHIPKPRVNYNVVFIRTPETPEGLKPIVVPPPQTRTIVYVLTKSGQIGQQVIEVPGDPNQTPEVYYVNYNDGDNPTLPGGISLQEALSSAVTQSGQVIGGVGGGGIGGGIGGGFGGGIVGGGISGGIVGGGISGGIVGGGISGEGISGEILGGGISGGIVGGGIGGGYSPPSSQYG